MKKVLFLFLTVLLFTIQSCKKDWVCTCQVTVTTAGVASNPQSIAYPIHNATHTEAVNECNGDKTTNTFTQNLGGFITTSSATCSL